MARLGNALIVLGLLVLGYAGLWQLGLAPGSRVTLPAPVALQRSVTPTAVSEPTVAPIRIHEVPTVAPRAVAVTPPPPAALPTSVPRVLVATIEPLPTLVVTAAAPVRAADAADRVAASEQEPAGGYAVRLAIPAIKLDTPVRQGGIVSDARGNPVWETLPFVAVHYGDMTARVGARGNAVIAGHVVTLQEGNVFRFLYRLNIDDSIEVWDEHDSKREFRVVDVRLVPPTDITVMEPTPDATLTLITCGGTFDPITREFSDRLIVTAKPR